MFYRMPAELNERLAARICDFLSGSSLAGCALEASYLAKVVAYYCPDTATRRLVVPLLRQAVEELPADGERGGTIRRRKSGSLALSLIDECMQSKAILFDFDYPSSNNNPPRYVPRLLLSTMQPRPTAAGPISELSRNAEARLTYALTLLSSVLSDLGPDALLALLPQLEAVAGSTLGPGCQLRAVSNAGGMLLSTVVSVLTSYRVPAGNWRARIIDGSGIEAWVDKEGDGCTPMT